MLVVILARIAKFHFKQFQLRCNLVEKYEETHLHLLQLVAGGLLRRIWGAWCEDCNEYARIWIESMLVGDSRQVCPMDEALPV